MNMWLNINEMVVNESENVDSDTEIILGINDRKNNTEENGTKNSNRKELD